MILLCDIILYYIKRCIFVYILGKMDGRVKKVRDGDEKGSFERVEGEESYLCWSGRIFFYRFEVKKTFVSVTRFTRGE